MNELYTGKENCSGCSACANICPNLAISMKADTEGFKYPAIQESLCSNCGLCKKVCAFQNGYDTAQNFDEPKVYAVKHTSDEVRGKSTSGGMFTVLSDEILAENGTVYGAAFNDKMIVCHQRAVDKPKRDSLRGSKYVQSDMGSTLRDIEIDLREGRKVLFTGTPCQTAAVKEYTAKRNMEVQNLILCDIICHGTPSPLMFSEYLRLCEKKSGKKIVNHIFRSKINGWHSHTEGNIFDNKRKDFKSYYSQLYKNMFYMHMILRPSCHNCKYTNLNRPSDITIADFWDIDKTMPEFDDNKGVSLVLLNTKKGSDAFEMIKDKIIWRRSNISDCLQPNMREPTKPSPQREEFWKDYYNKGFGFVMKKYFGYGLLGDIKRFIHYTLVNIHAVVKKVFNRSN